MANAVCVCVCGHWQLAVIQEGSLDTTFATTVQQCKQVQFMEQTGRTKRMEQNKQTKRAIVANFGGIALYCQLNIQREFAFNGHYWLASQL